MHMKYKLESNFRLCQTEDETEEQRQMAETAGESAITEGLAVIAVGHQKLLPTASCVSSAQAPVTVARKFVDSREATRLRKHSTWSGELKRCSMAHNCLQCIKYLMFVFNLLFWLGGCGILGVGIWLAVTQGNFATLSSSFPSLSAANLLIVTGTFVMIIGFVGCIGAIKENKCLLLSFFIMLLIIFLLELTVVILFFVYTDKIDKYAQRDLKKGLHLYGTDGNIGLTNAWSIIQTDFRCCGVSNYTDWFEVYNTTRVPDSCCLEFSENCGLHSPGTWWKAPCYETVKIWLQENLLAVGIFGLCTAMVQILGLTFAMTMYCQVVKADTYCA
ncbi:tetraspanin-4 isoform X2 [Columba livia]|uniref:tetraspanin-4 isoform X2 n=1 Tax=Columba livia TaxID=8932 RepID=UPI0031BA9BA8